LASEGLEKWGVTWLLVAGDSRPTHGLVLDEAAVSKAIASLEAHREYLADIPGHPAPRDLLAGIFAGQGEAMGAEAAVLFRTYHLRPFG